MNTFFRCGRYRFALDGAGSRPIVMGILNVTPDSFSDGGNYRFLDDAISRAEQMIADGVDIIDIGGESTRPGAATVSIEVELQRVMPIIFALRDCGKAISIDTYKPEVMREAIMAGVDMVNDVRGFASIEARQVVSDVEVGLCVMHMQNLPSNMQLAPAYADVNDAVTDFFSQRLSELDALGVDRARVCLDPGFGFGKTLAHNISMMRHLAEFRNTFDLPILAGLSRKSMIGEIVGRPVEQRLAGSLAAALGAVNQGARLLRVHDVAETVDAIKVWQQISN
ncbi:dihydropteroate synthase [Undibacterium parvum]|uniref:Dihydropteroate synthase n=1 Tax=Undibacterium parvum TaxID=401471 RepID=A0A3S9HPI1_9BURK|nr:dihydropteroate synthase [Undibacterium parvum]AZP13979.1 dihydropteroate synthase [Undibacterium parvum]